MPPAAPVPAAALILAAGRGSRMNSRLPTALHQIAGRPLAEYPVELARALGCERIVFVVGEDPSIRNTLGEGYTYAVQPAPTGTPDAVLAAADALSEVAGTLLILAVGAPQLTPGTVRQLLEHHLETGRPTTLASAPGEDPAACVFDASLLQQLRERRQSGGATELLQAFASGAAEPEIITVESPDEARVVRTRVDLAAATAAVRKRILEQHMLAGVTIEDPASTYIDHGVTIGQDTVIRPMTFLEQGTVIGEECELGPNVRISRCTLGDRVVVQNAVLAESTVGDDTRIGPFAQLRPGSSVGRKVKIGNFVELKKATVEDRVSLGHFAYMGDVFVGEKTNIGAGTITCNYDGKLKHVTRIGRNSFIGSNSTLVAPVEIGEGAYVAAGSVVTEEVPADALALGRSRQINKPEWAKKRRERE